MNPKVFHNTAKAFAYKSDRELKHASHLFQLMGNPHLVGAGSKLAGLALSLHLPVSALFRYSVYDQFCGGETFEECKLVIEKLQRAGVKTMLNYGVELKESETDFEKTIEKNLEAIAFTGANPSANIVCIKITGFGRFALFEKIQRNEGLSDSETEELNRVKDRMHRLAKAAEKNGTTLYVDAEESWIQDALDALTDEFMEAYNQQRAIFFNTFQLYRHDRLAFLKSSFEKAEKGNYILGAKLVRGAYMEKERERAASMGYPSPIHAEKKGVDRDFNEALAFCLDHLQRISVCIASQSEDSNLLAIAVIDQKKIDRKHPHVCFSQLYGMGDHITFNLADQGFNAYKYLPYGPVKDVIPYLIRRAQENTSVSGQMGRELRLLKEEVKRRKL